MLLYKLRFLQTNWCCRRPAVFQPELFAVFVSPGLNFNIPPLPPTSEIIVWMKNPASSSCFMSPTARVRPLPAHFIPFSVFRRSDYTLADHANVRPMRKAKRMPVWQEVSSDQFQMNSCLTQTSANRVKTEDKPATKCWNCLKPEPKCSSVHTSCLQFIVFAANMCKETLTFLFSH